MSAQDRLRTKLDRAVAPFLAPEETIEASVPAGTLHPAWLIVLIALVVGGGSTGYFIGGAVGGLLAGLVFALVNRNRVIVCTDRRIVLLNSGKAGPVKVQGVAREYPRAMPVGPIKGLLGGRSALPGKKLYVQRSWAGVVASMDARPTTAGTAVPTPVAGISRGRHGRHG